MFFRFVVKMMSHKLLLVYSTWLKFSPLIIVTSTINRSFYLNFFSENSKSIDWKMKSTKSVYLFFIDFIHELVNSICSEGNFSEYSDHTQYFSSVSSKCTHMPEKRSFWMCTDNQLCIGVSSFLLCECRVIWCYDSLKFYKYCDFV